MDFAGFTDRTFGSSNVEKKLERMFTYWLHRRRLLDALQKSGLSGVLVTRAIGLSVFESVTSNRFLTEEEQQAREYITLFVVSGFMSMVIQWHHEGYAQSVQQMVQIAMRLISQPLAPSLYQ